MAKKNELECLKTIVEAYCYKTSYARVNFDNADCRWLSHVLQNAKETGSDNAFPDFVSDGAIIEHFQITSAKEGRKGSLYLAEDSKNNAQWEREFQKKKDDFLNSPLKPGTLTSILNEHEYGDFSYENLLKSIKSNVDSHIKSLEKSGITNKKVIFIMEQPDARLCKTKTYSSCEFYLLHEDRRALRILKRYAHKIDFVIYKVADSIEVIDLSKIDYLIETGLDLSDVKPGKIRKIDIGLFGDVSGNKSGF